MTLLPRAEVERIHDLADMGVKHVDGGAIRCDHFADAVPPKQVRDLATTALDAIDARDQLTSTVLGLMDSRAELLSERDALRSEVRYLRNDALRTAEARCADLERVHRAECDALRSAESTLADRDYERNELRARSEAAEARISRLEAALREAMNNAVEPFIEDEDGEGPLPIDGLLLRKPDADALRALLSEPQDGEGGKTSEPCDCPTCHYDDAHVCPNGLAAPTSPPAEPTR